MKIRKNTYCLLGFVFVLLMGQSVSARVLQGDRDHFRKLQQQFVDLRFGMFIHFNIPTY